MRTMMLLPLLIGALVQTSSAGPDPLDLEQAVRTAEANSHRLEASRERAAAAQETYRQAFAHLFPTLQVMEIFDRTTNPVENFGMTLNKELFDPAAMGMPDLINRPAPTNTWVTRVEAKLPLYTGGRLTTGIRQAGLMAEASESEHFHTIEEVRLTTIQSWFDLAKAREYVELLERALSTTEAHVERARAYSDEGFLVRSELLRAEVYLAEMTDLLTQARQGTEMAQAALNMRMGLEQETPQTLAPTPELPVMVGDLDPLVLQALGTRRDLESARLKNRAGELNKRASLGGLLPEAGILARYDWYDEDLLGDQGKSWTVMGSVSWNLNLGGSQLWKMRSASHQSKAWQADIRRFEEGIRLQVRQSHSALELALNRQQTAQKALDAGRENLRIIAARFDQGIAAMIDLLDAQTALRELETRELVARHEALSAAYRLRLNTGQSVVDYKKKGE